MAEPQIYVARQSFATVIDGEHYSIVGGHTTVREGHKLLRNREHLFEPVRVHYDTTSPSEPRIEEATSRPGEVRKPAGRPKGSKNKPK